MWRIKLEFSLLSRESYFSEKEYILLYRARHKISKPAFFSTLPWIQNQDEETDSKEM